MNKAESAMNSVSFLVTTLEEYHTPIFLVLSAIFLMFVLLDINSQRSLTRQSELEKTEERSLLIDNGSESRNDLPKPKNSLLTKKPE